MHNVHQSHLCDTSYIIYFNIAEFCGNLLQSTFCTTQQPLTSNCHPMHPYSIFTFTSEYPTSTISLGIPLQILTIHTYSLLLTLIKECSSVWLQNLDWSSMCTWMHSFCRWHAKQNRAHTDKATPHSASPSQLGVTSLKVSMSLPTPTVVWVGVGVLHLHCVVTK